MHHLLNMFAVSTKYCFTHCSVNDMSFAPDTESKVPTLKHVIPKYGDYCRVNGLTIINNQLFVLRHPSEEEIQVYDTEVFTQQRTVRIPGLESGYAGHWSLYFDGYYWHHALTSCNANNCLYVCDEINVHKFDLTTDHVISWQVDGFPAGLSVNTATHVMVTCSLSHEIREYLTNGSLVRVIKLEITGPIHAVQLTDGQFVVSTYEGNGCFINLVDNRGRVVSRYGEGVLQFNVPRYLTVTKNGTILVADSYNKRIVALNCAPSSGRLKTLTLPICGQLDTPYCLYYSESNGRLFVGEASGERRVLIFDNINLSLDRLRNNNCTRQ